MTYAFYDYAGSEAVPSPPIRGFVKRLAALTSLILSYRKYWLIRVEDWTPLERRFFRIFCQLKRLALGTTRILKQFGGEIVIFAISRRAELPAKEPLVG